MINVVSQDEDLPAGGKTDQQRQERQQRNADRAQHRIDEDARLAQQQADHDQQEADAAARHNRLQGRNLNDAFDMVGNKPVFKTPSTNMLVAIESLKRLPDTLEIQNIQEDLQAYLQVAMVQTNERVAGPSVSGATSRSHQHFSRPFRSGQQGLCAPAGTDHHVGNDNRGNNIAPGVNLGANGGNDSNCGNPPCNDNR
jgi:hypothetical protein